MLRPFARGEKFDPRILRNNSQQHATTVTTCNTMCKRTQHVTSNNTGVVGQQLRPFARSFSAVQI